MVMPLLRHYSVDIFYFILGISEAIVFTYLFMKNKNPLCISSVIFFMIFLSLTPLNYPELWLALGPQLVFHIFFVYNNRSNGIEAPCKVFVYLS